MRVTLTQIRCVLAFALTAVFAPAHAAANGASFLGTIADAWQETGL